MKLMTSILTAAVMTGGVWAQNPSIINNVQNKMNTVEQQKTADSNAALGITGTPSANQPSKPPAGASAPATKPTAIPGATSTKPASAATAKPATTAKTAATAISNNKLERVNVVRHGDDIQIEMNSHDSVSPRVSKLTSPERLVVELPATAMATAQSKIVVGSAGVKEVRIGTNGKTPPTTSVVVDLEKAHGYDMTPGPSNKFILTLHGQSIAKNTPPVAPVKTSAPASKAQTVAFKPAAAPVATTPKTQAKTAAAPVPPAPKPAAATAKTAGPATSKIVPVSGKIVAEEKKPAGATKTAEAPKPPKPEEKKWAMNGKRDPFFSPVVQQSTGSGCSTGKKCLEIGQINLRGVVKAETGFIAVVTNSLDKAYFLHENDPVFNGYVVRITGDSVVFQETVQDKLGKPLTREVTKKITTPAV